MPKYKNDFWMTLMLGLVWAGCLVGAVLLGGAPRSSSEQTEDHIAALEAESEQLRSALGMLEGRVDAALEDLPTDDTPCTATRALGRGPQGELFFIVTCGSSSTPNNTHNDDHRGGY